MKNTKGILMFATGHPYYGRMAYNLAVTIKATGTDLPIAVVHDKTGLAHLDDQQLKIFDHFIQAKPNTTINVLRLTLPAYTPFSETLALDVDMLWIGGDPANLFELLNDRDFTAINEGYIDMDNNQGHTTGKYTHWADPNKIKEAYELQGRLYQIRGEFILLRKGKVATALYKEAKRVQRESKIETHRWADGDITDEFALNLAANKLGLELHQSQWLPTYWPQREGFLLPLIKDLRNEYYALSFGGNRITAQLKKMHDIIVKNACYKLGLPFVFTIQPKRNYLTERIFN